MCSTTFFRGRSVYLNPVTADSHAEAIGWYERALTVDPRSVEALSSLATSLAGVTSVKLVEIRD